MYIPEHFNQPDKAKTIAFIRANAFGQLVSLVEGKLFASHLPFMISSDGLTMLCHVARQNPQWQGIEEQAVLVTFQGPHDYISPTWYSAPGVPTWNYQAAHVYGTCKLIHEPEALKTIVDRLALGYERSFDAPWKPEYGEAKLRAIVGIEVSVSDIQCKFKLGQNRSTEDRDGVVRALEQYGSSELAAAMKENK